MALITELIEGYAEMTAEQKLEALEALEQPEDTDGKKWKAQYDRTAHDLAEQKKANKTLQEQLSSKMTEDELAKAESERLLAEREAEFNALKREVEVGKLTNKYLALGYPQELAESTANALYDNDFETVADNTGKFKESFEQSVRAGIVKGNPTPNSKGAGTKTLTKAKTRQIVGL